MHNTLDKFYNYVAEVLFRYFNSTNPLKAGDKYFLHLDNEEDVDLCFRQLVAYHGEFVEDFYYRYDADAVQYQTKCVRFGGIKLLLASHADATENFITLLRNQVALQNGLFQDTAILILFSGQLDSLLGGSGDLTKSGMPLGLESFYEDISGKIQHNFASQNDKRTILELALKNKVAEFPLGDLNIFDFNRIIAIVQNGVFEDNDYHLLGLFPHAELSSIIDANRIIEKIEQNHKLFETIEYAVNYGNVQSDLDKLLTSGGVTAIEQGVTDESWKLIDYSSLEKYFVKPEKEKPIEYKGAEQSEELDSDVWERKDDKNRRLFHVIIYNKSCKYPLSQNFTFSGSLTGNLSYSFAADKGAVIKVGKQIRLTVNCPICNSDTLQFEYIDKKVPSVKFRFRIWVLNGSSDFLQEYNAKYGLSTEGQLVVEAQNKVRLNRIGFEKDEFELVPETVYSIENRELSLLIRGDDEDTIPFTLIYNGQSLDVLVKQQIGVLKPITGWDVWQNKRIEQKSYQYTYVGETDTLKLLLNNEERVPRDEFRKNLLLEMQMMDQSFTAWFESETAKLTERPLRLSSCLQDAYFAYVEVIRSNGSLPSLFYHNQRAREIANNYVEAFLSEINEIGDNEILNEDTKADLLLLGTIAEIDKNQVVKFTPLHPLMVAYQLEVYSQIKQNKLYDAMLKKLTPLNLLPYIFWKNQKAGNSRDLYASKENNHSPEWQYYSHDLHFKQFAGREFIRDLVNQKIHEFVINFSFLFTYDLRAPIKINVFNMGDCLQVLQGIFDYYKDRVLSGVAMHELRPIELYLHGSLQYVTTFERLSNLVEQGDIERSFDLTTNTKRIDFEDLINVFRSKVHYYAVEDSTESQYAHLTFYQFDSQHTSVSYRDHDKISSGLSLNGLLSDLPSYYHDLTYVTGFGSNFVPTDSQLIKLAKGYNSIAKVSFSKDPFEQEKVICTTINNDVKSSLSQLYDHSQWVVFVDPHFDLTFFKDESDLIIVHYSDQYSNASGFDAITVSRKSNQYRHLLATVLDVQHIPYSDADILRLINLYNAINGEWLIKMIGNKNEKARKEKLSIPAAVKLFLAYFDHPEIIWVPVSLEEILRISGGAGLSKAEGLFSTSNLGAKNEHSDDLLMIGLYEKDGRLNIQLYPVEVKIGINKSDVLIKARNQALKTYDLLYQHLTTESKSFEAAFYRSFFAKLAIMNANKMELYEAWPEKNWKIVTNNYRSRLLNDDFVITTKLSQFINKYTVIAFTQSPYIRSYELEEDGILLTHFEEDSYQYLVKSVNEIKEWLFNTPSSIKKEALFVNRLPQLSRLPEDEIARLETVGDIGTASLDENSELLVDDPGKDLHVNKSIAVGQLFTEESSLPIPAPEDGSEMSESTVNIPEESIPVPTALLPEPFFQEDAEVSEKQPMQIYFGNSINDGEPLYWYPTDTTQVMHSNTGIIGTMGTGKTQFTKSLVTQLHRQNRNNVDGKPIGILIFDYKGDYIDDAFVEAAGAKVYDLYDLPYNPLTIDVTPRSVPLLPLHVASTLQETISLAFNLGNKQKSLLKEIIMQAYEDKDILKNDRESWRRTAPTIADVYERYLQDERMTTDSLYAALNQLYEFQIFQPDGSKTKSLFELIEGVTVIKLSGYGTDIQNLVVAITLDAFYSQMQKSGHSKIDQNFRQITKIILVDEADNFLSKNFISIRKILKEGREFGVGTLLSTQFLSHFSTGDNEYAQYILTWIVHRVNDIKMKDVESLFPVSDKEQKEQLMQMIKKLEKHRSVVNLAGSKPIFIDDYPFWKLIS